MAKTRSGGPGTAGQALLVVVLIATVLFISITVLILFNQIGSSHQAANQQKSKALSVAREGIYTIMSELGATAQAWQNALGGDFNLAPDCNGGPVNSPSGGRFRVTCSADPAANPGLQPYQVAVVSVALGGPGGSTPLRAVKAYLSKRTLGADLNTGFHAPAAVQLVRVPVLNPILNPTGNLDVQWGPIHCLDSNPWTLYGTIDTQRYPRKISVGGIAGSLVPGSLVRAGATYSSGLVTDQKEYWAYAPQEGPPLIDEESYKNLAKNTDITVAGLSGFVPFPNLCPAGHAQCGYIDAQPTVTFDGGYNIAASLNPNRVVYVNGDAVFKDVAIDNAVFIITGNLTISDSFTPLAPANLHVPVTALSDYPFPAASSWPFDAASAWPCSGKEGHMNGAAPMYDCPSPSVFGNTGNPGTVQFHGFLYVKKILRVNLVNKQHWNMAGALLVGDTQEPTAGGQLIVNANASLNVAYDDKVNHDILVNPSNGVSVPLAPDRIEDIAVQ